MQPISSFLSRSLAAGANPAAVAFALTACAAPRPEVDVEAAIEAAVPASAIEFRAAGDPLDAAPQPRVELTRAEALRRAVERSPELQAALARVRVALAEAQLARLLPNPILDVVLRFPEGGGSAEVEAGIAADLLSILQRPRRSSAAAHRLEAAAAAALATALDVVAEVQELYVRAQTHDALVALLASRLALLERLRDVVQARLELGEGTRQDVTAFEAERAELDLELSGQRLELHRVRLALARRIGEPSSAADWPLDPWQAPPALPIEESPWIEAGLAARPDVLALAWEIRARVDETALAGSTSLTGSSVGAEAERQGDWSAGPSAAVPLPVFDTGDARSDRARAAESEARHRLTEAQRAAVEEVRGSLAEFAASQASLERVAGELLPLAERHRSDVESGFQLGHLDVTALLIAERDLQGARARQVVLEQEVSLARIRLERAVGGPTSLESTVALGAQEVQP